MEPHIKARVTLDAFEAFIAQPENADKSFEFIAGEIVEVTSNPYASKIAMLVGAAIIFYLNKNDIGHVTGADGGYRVSGQRYIPDVGYISYERQPQLDAIGYNPNPPNLAVEVISDPNNGAEINALLRKVSSYLAASVVVWVVNPETHEVDVHRAGDAPTTLTVKDSISAEDILPGFKLAVKDVFPAQKA